MARRSAEPPPCPQADQHTPAPASYTGYHHWSARMSRTHMQTRCPGCGLYEVWIPKVARPARTPEAAEEATDQ
jgi:hypothetical protein